MNPQGSQALQEYLDGIVYDSNRDSSTREADRRIGAVTTDRGIPAHQGGEQLGSAAKIATGSRWGYRNPGVS